MKFTYKPEGTEPEQWKVWVFDPKKLMNVEAEAIEKVTGLTFPDWHNAVLEESTAAIHGLLWVLLKRETPTLTYDQIAFAYDDYELDLDDSQKAGIVAEIEAQVARGEPLTPEAEELLESYRAALADVEEPEGEEADPKDSPEPSSDPDTSGTSPSIYEPLELISTS